MLGRAKPNVRRVQFSNQRRRSVVNQQACVVRNGVNV